MILLLLYPLQFSVAHLTAHIYGCDRMTLVKSHQNEKFHLENESSGRLAGNSLDMSYHISSFF